MIPRCPHCGRIVTRERVRLHHVGGSQPSRWWWCTPCGTRVEPAWLKLARNPRRQKRKRTSAVIACVPQRGIIRE